MRATLQPSVMAGLPHQSFLLLSFVVCFEAGVCDVLQVYPAQAFAVTAAQTGGGTALVVLGIFELLRMWRQKRGS